MNPDIKERWVSALRSGRYPKGTLRLNNNGEGFCCLGVLCEIAVEDQVVFTKLEGDDVFYTSKLDPRDSNSALAPEAVSNWAGLEGANPYVTVSQGLINKYPDLYNAIPPEDFVDGRVRYSLAGLNDSHVSFDDIADLIEEQL